jgi:hypothetical protein
MTEYLTLKKRIKTMAKVVTIIASAVLLFGIVIAMIAIGWNNTEIDLRNNFNAQLEVRTGFYDKMWKILSQQAQITDKYKSDFKEIYIPMIEGRYKSGGGLMKWIQERNPEFDSTMYTKLMVSVEAQREGFFREQKKLVDIKLQHDNLRKKFPSSIIVGGAEELQFEMITSSKTKKVIESGEENDIELFKK